MKFRVLPEHTVESVSELANWLRLRCGPICQVVIGSNGAVIRAPWWSLFWWNDVFKAFGWVNIRVDSRASIVVSARPIGTFLVLTLVFSLAFISAISHGELPQPNRLAVHVLGYAASLVVIAGLAFLSLHNSIKRFLSSRGLLSTVH